MSRRRMVHFTHVLTSLGDGRIAVPILNDQDTWIADAITKELPRWGAHHIEELSIYLIDPAAERLFVDAIDEAAKRNDLWCGPCVAWAKNPEHVLCSAWEELADGLTEFGFDICHMGNAMHREAKRAGGVKLPPILAETFFKLAHDAAQPGSAANKFVFQTASPFLKAQLRKHAGSVFGTVVSERLLDELFEAAFRQMRGETPTGAQKMTPEEAAEILGCPWPCTADELKAAYRLRTRQTHPDMHRDATEAEKADLQQQFVRVCVAHEVLSNAVK